MDTTRQILSIQSHVVHGYVGNKAATFPLQYRGWNVDALNTVQFSNHPGYGSFTGFREHKADMYQIIESGLINGLQLNYDVILTGYLPSVHSLKSICELINNICKEKNTPWILDPVLGDNGKLYVDMECVNIYKELLSQCSIYLTVPNQFEMETLTDIRITDMGTLKRSLVKFHDLYPGVQRVIVSSIDIGTKSKDGSGTYTVAFAEGKDFSKFKYFTVDKINAHFNGSGDLFSASLVDMLFPHSREASSNPADLWEAIGKALTLTHQILARTYQLTIEEDTNVSSKSKSTVPHIKDLKLIQCTDLLRTDTLALQTDFPLCAYSDSDSD